ncbi:hypothetical protein [Brachyspira aalborgi]|uniref:hypothetical protein n=1 Tax=Brachyspira aalborgi TaxID=29522 RepID=UPI00266664F1|nr:hypothetical protein [Brachyspira aalborgi]
MKHTKNILKSLLITVMALSISCKSNENPNTGAKEEEEKTFASYAGTWYGDMRGSGEEPLITINSDGSFKILGGDINIPSSNITKNSDKSYTASVENGTITFDFSSDTQATVDFGKGGELLTITKK